jgi:hypothetical protein
MVGIHAAGAVSVKRDKRSLPVGSRRGVCKQSSQDTQTASTYDRLSDMAYRYEMR